MRLYLIVLSLMDEMAIYAWAAVFVFINYTYQCNHMLQLCVFETNAWKRWMTIHLPDVMKSVGRLEWSFNYNSRSSLKRLCSSPTLLTYCIQEIFISPQRSIVGTIIHRHKPIPNIHIHQVIHLLRIHSGGSGIRRSTNAYQDVTKMKTVLNASVIVHVWWPVPTCLPDSTTDGGAEQWRSFI